MVNNWNPWGQRGNGAPNVDTRIRNLEMDGLYPVNKNVNQFLWLKLIISYVSKVIKYLNKKNSKCLRSRANLTHSLEQEKPLNTSAQAWQEFQAARARR